MRKRSLHFCISGALLLILLLVGFQNCSRSSGEFEAASNAVDSTKIAESIRKVETTVSQNGTISAWAQLGLGEPVIENAIHKPNWTIDAQMDKIVALRPKLFRLWLPTGYLFDATGNRTNTYLPLFRRAVDRLYKAGIPIMGMDHSFPSWMTGAISSSENWNTVPCRDMRANSPYIMFLNKYESHWREIARLFPEISAWETANETNGRESLKPIQSGPGSCGRQYFSFDERVLVTIDLMERASRAIKAVQPSAIVFMSPPGPVFEDNQNDPSLKSIERFVRAIYAAIASWNGNARSYFDGVSWHPYIFQQPTFESWILPNEAIYKVMVEYGDRNIPVIFSEMGNSELNYDPLTSGLIRKSPEELSLWMQDAIRLSQTHSPWLAHIVWFRAFDDQSAESWGGEHQVRFGILSENYPTFSPKPSAHIFCKFTGCVNEPFRAWITGFGWSAFWLNGSSYCQYSSPGEFTRLTGMDLMLTLPWLAAIDTRGMNYVGMCN